MAKSILSSDSKDSNIQIDTNIKSQPNYLSTSATPKMPFPSKNNKMISVTEFDQISHKFIFNGVLKE